MSYKSQEARFKLAYVASVSVRFRSKERPRLQNSPYFCVFKYTRAVKQKVWTEAENRERDWGETLIPSRQPPYRRVRRA